MAEQMELNLEMESVPTNFADCPNPGIYFDKDFDEYRSWRAFNSGVIKYGEISQCHMHAAFNGEISNEDTQSRKFGRAVHTRLLEPAEYAARVCISQPCCAVLKTGDRKGEFCGKSGTHVLDLRLDVLPHWYCGTHRVEGATTPKEFVTQEEHDRIERMAKMLHDHPAMALLKAAGWSECSVVYDFNGLRVKGRIDRYSRKSQFVLDAKKCRVGYGTMELCRKAIAEYGYMRQMAIYQKGIEILEGFKPRCLWLFIEEAAPYCPQIVEADQWELDHAWEHVAGILSGYKASQERGRFDGYVKLDNQGNILSNHVGGYPTWMAKAIQEGRA